MAIQAMADMHAFSAIHVPYDALPSMLERLAIAIPEARPHAVRNVQLVGNNPGLLSAAALAGVAVVDLSNCVKLTHVTKRAHVCEAVAAAQGQDTDRAKSRYVRQLNAIGEVDTLSPGKSRDICKLDLEGCKNITVIMLGGVRRLDLTGCTGVTDVSALGRVHDLVLSQCHSVEDVSNLGGVHGHAQYIRLYRRITWYQLPRPCAHTSLRLTGMDVTPADVHALGSVHHICFLSSKTLTTAAGLGRVYSLDLSYSRRLTDVSARRRVQTLILSGCDSTERAGWSQHAAQAAT